MKKSVRLSISGSVQGMFFRQFIKENADQLNVRGFIRNLETGNVEVFLEGNNEEVERMIEVCKKGTPHSLIRDVSILNEKFQDFRDFKILKF